MSAPVLTPQQALGLALCDAWLDEFDLFIMRVKAKEPIYKPLSRLWDTPEEKNPATTSEARRRS